MQLEQFPWQSAAVLAMIAWAGFYLVRRVRQACTVSGKSGCGSCSNATNPSTGITVKPFVSIDSLNPPTLPLSHDDKGSSGS